MCSCAEAASICLTSVTYHPHHACSNTFFLNDKHRIHIVCTNLVKVDKKPLTSPVLTPAGDIFCSLLFDHPGHSAKLGTLSFTSTANSLRNTAEAEQSTNLCKECDSEQDLLQWEDIIPVPVVAD